MIKPMLPRDITSTVGIVGPWAGHGLYASRRDISGRDIVSVDVVSERAARINLRAEMDQEAWRMGWILYEEAPAWLQAMFELCKVKA